MLFDLLGSFSVLTGLIQDQVSRGTALIPIGAIPIWDQYRDFLDWCLNHLGDIFGSGGLAIVAFTIIIKTLLLPLTIKSIRSSKAMQEIAPKVKEIQKKYGKDRQRASQETMALYQQHGVNPMAGCLPMILQIPIFFGLYHSISGLSKGGVGIWHDGFLWLPSLADADPWKILPIMAGLFQFIQARMMRPAGQKVTDPQQQVMNTMMNFMPLMVVLFGWNFASGPVIYWVTQSLYSVVQQWLITGWGSFGEWFPFLPELPAHRRLGYQDPTKLKDVVVLSGQAGAAQKKGFSGWLNNKMMEAQESAQARQETAKSARSGSGGTAKSGTSSASRTARSGTKASRNGAAASDTEADVIETEGDVIDESMLNRTQKRQSNYQSRATGSKFGSGKTATSGETVATATASASSATATTSAKPAVARKTGKTRTKPQRRPTS